MRRIIVWFNVLDYVIKRLRRSTGGLTGLLIELALLVFAAFGVWAALKGHKL